MRPPAVEFPFPLDDFQRRATAATDAGECVLVAAPTGSGKTVVAEHAVARALAAGHRAFYTTPLKALSNQKYAELRARHGPGRVGLLTGDAAIDGDAPAVVMTTEVLRNMIYDRAPGLDRVRCVVLDEVHYLQDAYRGSVWEEVIIHAPPEAVLVCLSATVSNAEELSSWIRTVRGPTTAVIEHRRPVALHHHYLLPAHHDELPGLVATFAGAEANPAAARLDARTREGQAWTGGRGRPRPPRRTEVIAALGSEGMLPAIYFVFSRAGCDDAVTQCLRTGARLTTAEERAAIAEVAASAVGGLSERDLAALDHDRWLAALEAGVASHHAGLVPPFKEAVERAFAQGLVKVVFATETLALGVNMPARAVVIERLSKFSGERHQLLTAAEYTQLTGRAGRRGIDDVGHAVVVWSPWARFEQVATLAGTRTYHLRSSFRPTYNMAANLVRRCSPERARQLLDLSFAQYQADREVVRLRAAGEAEEADRRRAGAAATCERGDVEEYRRLVAEATRGGDPASRRRSRAAVADALAGIRPGDVIALEGGKSGGRVAVVSVAQRRGGDVRLGAVTAGRRYLTLSARDFEQAPPRVGRLTLPQPYAPRSPRFQRAVARALGQARLGRPGGPAATRGPAAAGPDGGGAAGPEAWRRMEGHPVHGCGDRDRHLAAAERRDRLDRLVGHRQAGIDRRTQALSQQLDRVLTVLGSWGYVDGWHLTPAGELLRSLYHECDLLVAEAVRRGLLDGLDAALVAGLASTFTYEPRRPPRGPGPGGGGRQGRPPARPEPEAWFPTGEARLRWEDVAALAQELRSREEEAGMAPTRAPHPGFLGATYRWANGEELADILAAEEVTGGDFVRTVRQVLDLVRQLALVAPHPATAAAAAEAATRLDRGVVRASAAVGT